MNNKTQSAITPSSTQRHCHRIILIGYMGAGKTTVGKALAAESRMRKTVAQLFAELGEEGFRRIERNMLHEVAEFEGVLISCGGGTPCFYDNMQYINQQGLTLYLKASPEVLYKHLKMGKSVRPLLLNKTPEEVQRFISEQLKAREQFYTRAQFTLDVNLMDNFDKIKISVAQARQLLNV